MKWLSFKMNIKLIFCGKEIKIFLSAAVICDGNPQTVDTVKGRIRGCRHGTFMQEHENFLVQGIEYNIVHTPRIKPQTDDIEYNRCKQFQIRRLRYPPAKIFGLFDVTVDHSAEPFEAVLFYGHPDFQGPEIT